MIVAERLQASEHLIDLGLLGRKGVQGGFAVAPGLLGAQLVAGCGDRVEAGHGLAPLGELDRFHVITIALLRRLS